MKKILNAIIKYFKGVRKEIGRIRWTNGKELTKYSLTTITFMIVIGTYFYAIDMLIALLRNIRGV